MLKKTLAAVVVAGALLFTGASAANADYTPDDNVTVSDSTPAPGQTIVITITGIADGIPWVTFSTTDAGVTLSSIVPTAVTSSVQKDVVDGTASANFVAAEPGNYTVTVTDPDGNVLETVGITVAAAGAGDDDELPSTGGTVPAVALWVGAGALGLGGLAVVAGTARRRAAQR